LPREFSDIKEETISLKSPFTGQSKIITNNEEQAKIDHLNNLPDDRDALSSTEKVLLIIEDEPRFAEILIKTGRSNGFKCIHAPDGELGLSYASEYKPVAIILDIMLPQMDGWAVLSRLKENVSTRHIPVQFISCMEENHEAFKQGAISYMTKPLGLDELKQVFKNFEDKLNKPLKDILIASNHNNIDKILN
jgi:CheY-like chemotaxis protein